MDGDVQFVWNGDPSQSYNVKITRDDKAHYPWFRVTGTQYTVEDALLYDSISINVRVPDEEIDNKITYKGIIYMPHPCNMSYGATVGASAANSNLIQFKK